jgi:hypothetical protein
VTKAIWRVEGFDGTSCVYRRDVAATDITRFSLEALLRALAAQHGLSRDEAVDCYLRADRKAHRTLLDVRVEVTPGMERLTCGTNPHLVATLIPSHEPGD